MSVSAIWGRSFRVEISFWGTYRSSKRRARVQGGAGGGGALLSHRNRRSFNGVLTLGLEDHDKIGKPSTGAKTLIIGGADSQFE